MTIVRKPMLLVPLAGAVLLGGCATGYRDAPPPRFSYFAVPCGSPGAIPAVPIPPPGAPLPPPPAAAAPPPAAAPAPLPTLPPMPPSGAGTGAPQCVVAVLDPRQRYRYYGPPFAGSIGIGIGHGWGGGHWGGHWGGHGGGHGWGHR